MILSLCGRILSGAAPGSPVCRGRSFRPRCPVLSYPEAAGRRERGSRSFTAPQGRGPRTCPGPAAPLHALRAYTI